MKHPLLLLLISFAVASCTQFKYLTVSGVNVPKTDKNELIAENDTVRIQYHFTDYKGKVGITLLNKTNEPIEIDWKKSAIIVNGKAYSYYNPNASFSAKVQNDSTNSRLNSVNIVYLADINGNILIDEPTQFIPLGSTIHKVPLTMPLQPLQNLPENDTKKEVFIIAEGVALNYKKTMFEKDKFPIVFRSYLTLRMVSSLAQKEFVLDHQFYISEIWQSSSSPEYFPGSINQLGDRFYLAP